MLAMCCSWRVLDNLVFLLLSQLPLPAAAAGVLNASSKEDDVAAEVCMRIVRCYSVSAQFQASRDRLMLELVMNICRLLYYKYLAGLCSVAVDTILLMHFLQRIMTNPISCSRF